MKAPTRTVTLALLGLVLAFGHVDSQNNELLQRNAKEAAKAISGGVEKFSLEVILRTALSLPNRNLIMSPFSIWAMMSVLTEGAGGQTLTELKTVLRHPQDKQTIRESFRAISQAFLVNTPTIQLESVNAIFCDVSKNINQRYADLVKDYYLTQINKINFRTRDAVDRINNEMSRSTRGRIKEIVDANDLQDAQMLITNAIFFKGQWTHPFNKSLTREEDFFDENGNKIGRVNMMLRRGPFAYANMKDFEAHVVELPYGEADCDNLVVGQNNCPTGEKQNRLSMFVFLPHYKVSLQKLYNKFTQINFDVVVKKLAQALENSDDEVDVFLPRFNITSDIIMNTVLNNMGMYEVFDPAYSDLSGISSNIYLSRVIHKAVIEVNEEGTVASAITEGELANRNTPAKFLANKPFIYLLIEKNTNIAVFGGVYQKPELV